MTDIRLNLDDYYSHHSRFPFETSYFKYFFFKKKSIKIVNYITGWVNTLNL